MIVQVSPPHWKLPHCVLTQQHSYRSGVSKRVTKALRFDVYPRRGPDYQIAVFARVPAGPWPKFYRKVHCAGTLLFSGFHSHLTLLQYSYIHLPNAQKPLHVISDVYFGWRKMALRAESHRWRSAETIAWLRKRGLYLVPFSIKAEIGDLVHNRVNSRASNDPTSGL